MTSVNATSTTSNIKPFEFNKTTFSDPSMRSYLEEFYEAKYAPLREHIASMKEAETSGQAPPHHHRSRRHRSKRDQRRTIRSRNPEL